MKQDKFTILMWVTIQLLKIWNKISPMPTKQPLIAKNTMMRKKIDFNKSEISIKLIK
jgi:hypothetical protein